jgi:Uma2 family endonuclease
MTTAPMQVQAEEQIPSRRFEVGTLGWTADDLDDPEIERQWDEGRYEIVEGVLTKMAAAHFDGGSSLLRLVMIAQTHVDDTGAGGEFAVEADVILEQMRVPRVDAVYLTREQLQRQEALNAASGRPRGKYGRVRVVPALAIEAVSIGHEAHDRKTKRRWYAEAGVPNYWMLDAYGKTVECLILEGGEYRLEQTARGEEELKPSLFPGLVVPLRRIWR